MRDFDALKADPAYLSKWVEPSKEDARKKWVEFVKEVSKLPKHANWSNWYDSFKTVVDLKPLVRKRLSDHFPQQLGSVALHPDRVLRVVFVHGATGAGDVRGHFKNVGPGPAYNVRHGSRVGTTTIAPAYRGGLAENEALLENQQDPRYLTTAPGVTAGDERIVFCEYENRFGDGYRVDVPLFMPDPNRNWQFRAERFFVRLATGDWLKITDANEG